MATGLSPLPAALNGWSFVVRSQSGLSGPWEGREAVEKGKSWEAQRGNRLTRLLPGPRVL